MTIAELVDQVRLHINDTKLIAVQVVNELPGEGKNTPHASINKWNAFSTGVNHEEFLTRQMPLVSGTKALLRGGRWAYDFAGQFPDNYTQLSGKKFLIDYYRGVFIVASGATPIPSGEKVQLTYSHWEDREFRFSDDEVKSWVTDGDSYLRERIELPYQISGRGSTLAFSTVPSGIHFSLLALTTSYFMRRRLQEEGIQDGIFIRDGDTAFDTTKTLVHRGKQLDQVKGDIDAIIMDVKMGELSTAGFRIDSYSTKDYNTASHYNMETNRSGADPWVVD